MTLIYKLAIRVYYSLIWLASFFNKKAKLWITGRRQVFEQLHQSIQSDKKTIWIHSASLGEFEQGRPIIEAIKKDFPAQQIVLSFYSPSGYEIRKNYAAADVVCYLPLDTAANAKRFLEIVNPQLAIFVKYEFWHYYLKTLKAKQTKTILVSGAFRENQVFFKSYGGFFKKTLHCFDQFFVQNEASKKLLEKINLKNIIVAGDTRIDRVLSIAQDNKSFPVIDAFCQNEKTLIAGSTWPADEKILIPTINQSINNRKYIIAPHEIDNTHLLAIEQQLKVPFARFSQCSADEATKIDVLIIDNIGMLSALYRYGDIAYIGGGFGKGIHNTLEPAAFSLPIIFGPKFQKFEEAKQFVQNGGAFKIENEKDFVAILEKLNHSEKHQAAAQKVALFVEKNKGATNLIMQYLKRELA